MIRDQTSDVDSIDSRTRRSSRKNVERKYDEYESLQATTSQAHKNITDGVRKCYNLLQRLKKHPSAGPFLEPVDVEGLGLYDYYDYVKEPMDLSTVERKLNENQYAKVSEFAADIRKIWNNSFLYNAKGSYIYRMTVEMSNFFEKLFKEIEDISLTSTIKDLEKQVEKLSKQISSIHQSSVSRQSITSRSARGYDKPLTTEEKRRLGENIRQLNPEHLRGVWEIVSVVLSDQTNREELEFDIDVLPPHVARELQRYVNNKIQKGRKQITKEMIIPEPEKTVSPFGDIEIQDTAMFKNLSISREPPNETNDEDESSESSFLSE